MIAAALSLRNRRICVRYQARSKVKVACSKGPLGRGSNLGISLLDVSETGVRLLVKSFLETGQEVSLSLEVVNQWPIKIPGKVIWCIPTGEGTFCVGIRLQKYLKYQDIVQLV